MLTLRAAPDTDSAQLAARAQRSTAHAWSERAYRDSLAAGHAVYLLEQDGIPVGQAVLMRVGDEAELLDIVIEGDAQGHGLGRTLMEQLLATLTADGCQRLLLEVRESNARARRLYLGAGLSECGRRRDYYPCADGRETAILMEAVL
jgi:ribosomal-protein-alanine N-acetyltransferase